MKLIASSPMRKRSNRALACCVVVAVLAMSAPADSTPAQGIASWYGEAHRGRLMADGTKFDPDKLTAASWFYPLGTRVRVTVNVKGREARSVVVAITDRGPARRLVREGRIIDLSLAAFATLAHRDLGLIPVKVERVDSH
jgi:rare lipoprotein A